jgi:hypothetical protein
MKDGETLREMYHRLMLLVSDIKALGVMIGMTPRSLRSC